MTTAGRFLTGASGWFVLDRWLGNWRGGISRPHWGQRGEEFRFELRQVRIDGELVHVFCLGRDEARLLRRFEWLWRSRHHRRLRLRVVEHFDGACEIDLNGCGDFGDGRRCLRLQVICDLGRHDSIAGRLLRVGGAGVVLARCPRRFARDRATPEGE